MGDRTHCTLRLIGSMVDSNIPGLAKHIDEADTCFGGGYEDIKETLQQTPATDMLFEFEEVNYAGMEENLSKYLANIGMGCVWSWAPGDDYPEGVTYVNGYGESASFTTVDTVVSFTIEELNSTENSGNSLILRAKKWTEWAAKGVYEVIYEVPSAAMRRADETKDVMSAAKYSADVDGVVCCRVIDPTSGEEIKGYANTKEEAAALVDEQLGTVGVGLAVEDGDIHEIVQIKRGDFEKLCEAFRTAASSFEV